MGNTALDVSLNVVIVVTLLPGTTLGKDSEADCG